MKHVTLIDTAEMYGEGLSEALVGEAIEGRRELDAHFPPPKGPAPLEMI